MLFLIALIIAVSFSLLCAPALRKKPLPFYIAAALLSAAVVILAQYRIENEIMQKYIIAVFSKGSVATAFWCVVMFAGALPQKSTFRKRLMPSRGELSIFSALLTLSHIVTYAVIYIKRLINPDFDPQTDFIATCAVVILLLCIMIPLTVMSFKKVRSKMKPKTWKNIQRTAYLFFALIYVHVLVLYLPRAIRGTDGYLLTVTVYTAVWALYLVMRLRKYFTERRNTGNTAAVNTLSVLGVAVPVIAVFFTAGGLTEKDDIPVAAPVTPAVTNTTEVTSSSRSETSASQTTTIPASSETTVAQTTVELMTTTVSETVMTVETTETAAEAAATTAPASETDEVQRTAEDTTAVQTTLSAASAVTTTAATTTVTTAASTTTTAITDTTTVEETEPPASKIYNDGTFTGKAYGYDGYIYVTITVENDMITSISSICEEEDISYWLSCRDKVTAQIIDSQQTEVDAVSGATYSSNAIMKAVAAALETARK